MIRYLKAQSNILIASFLGLTGARQQKFVLCEYVCVSHGDLCVHLCIPDCVYVCLTGQLVNFPLVLMSVIWRHITTNVRKGLLSHTHPHTLAHTHAYTHIHSVKTVKMQSSPCASVFTLFCQSRQPHLTTAAQPHSVYMCVCVGMLVCIFLIFKTHPNW